VTQSRGLGHLLGERLRAHPGIADAAGPGDVKISGCPNGCGQHHIAAIGFQGSIRRLGERAVPQYFVMVGGGVDADGASFGRIVAKIPARRCADAVDRIVALYRTHRQPDESLAAYLRHADAIALKAALAGLETITEETAHPDDFIDLAEDHAFAPEVLDGECSA
jgi:sulfite reductase beta subunit-like hemoprotein